jgi:hypothetical protein
MLVILSSFVYPARGAVLIFFLSASLALLGLSLGDIRPLTRGFPICAKPTQRADSTLVG